MTYCIIEGIRIVLHIGCPESWGSCSKTQGQSLKAQRGRLMPLGDFLRWKNNSIQLSLFVFLWSLISSVQWFLSFLLDVFLTMHAILYFGINMQVAQDSVGLTLQCNIAFIRLQPQSLAPTGDHAVLLPFMQNGTDFRFMHRIITTVFSYLPL